MGRRSRRVLWFSPAGRMATMGSRLASAGIATAELGYFNKFGSEIWREPRGIAAGYRWPQFSIHRGSLQKLLLEEYEARIGSPRLHAGWHLASFEQEAGGVTGRFLDKETGAPREEQHADVLVAAGGVHCVPRLGCSR